MRNTRRRLSETDCSHAGVSSSDASSTTISSHRVKVCACTEATASCRYLTLLRVGVTTDTSGLAVAIVRGEASIRVIAAKHRGIGAVQDAAEKTRLDFVQLLSCTAHGIGR